MMRPPVLSALLIALALRPCAAPFLRGKTAAKGTCLVGEKVLCPGSPGYAGCQGNECCEGPVELGTFVCPSAEPGWNGCNRTKRYDCVRGEVPKQFAPKAKPYFPHFDTSPDPLHIADRARGVRGQPGHLSDNYYLVIGDWGACGWNAGACEMQREVAEKMHKYVVTRKEANPLSSLMFVLSVGDNTQNVGATAEHFTEAWRSVYAPELLEVPWFAVFGNHDYGNDDKTSGCPSVIPRFECNTDNLHTEACGGVRPYSTEAQGYNSNQLDANKGGLGGEGRANFHIPDYTYFYSVPELRFELIAMDWNWLAGFPGPLGGRGDVGSNELLAHCGGAVRVSEELRGIQEASTELLRRRAAAAKHDNVAIISHYPDEFQGGANFRRMFMEAVPPRRREAMTVFNFFGHTHRQECRGYNDRGQCGDFLTGGGGGCCWKGDVPAGFAAITFSDANATQVVECFVEDACTVIYGT